MARLELKNRWVLVTGASSGLGLEMARVLASQHGANIIAVARRADRLSALQAELESKHGVKVAPLAADLSRTGEPQRLFESAIAGRDVAGAVLNAGVTFFGRALELAPAAFESMVATNITSLVDLSQRFSTHFLQQGTPSGLMLVASMAGFSPLPYQTAYAATKSFVISYGRGLAYELRKTGVSVTVFTPGGIATEMLELSGLDRKFKAGDLGIMSAEECARLAVGAFVRRKELYVPGLLNRLLALSMKLLPHGVIISRSGSMYAGGLKPPS
ncbi:hypothetical protein DRW03_16805 [Corallococcus sp. H22C18031201]|nr:hypothetical protein DRW03_16805 [Corallococcus sp. H22C18031201]